MKVTFNDKKFRQLMQKFPRQVLRAGEITIDRVAFDIRDEIKKAMRVVFDRPTPYTLNSLRVERTKNHNMTATVWFKEPDRMERHYLEPQVEGGSRKLKGFERALGGMPFTPSKYAKLDRYGNLPYGVVVQILSVLKKAEHVAGFMANVTERSKKRNRKPRDYVHLEKRHGKLPPGIYRRVQTGVGFGQKTKKTLPFGEYQKGRRRGRFASVIKARGLRPVLIQSKHRRVSYTPRLPFYKIAKHVVDTTFGPKFSSEFKKQLARISGGAQ